MLLSVQLPLTICPASPGLEISPLPSITAVIFSLFLSLSLLFLSLSLLVHPVYFQHSLDNVLQSAHSPPLCRYHRYIPADSLSFPLHNQNLHAWCIPVHILLHSRMDNQLTYWIFIVDVKKLIKFILLISADSRLDRYIKPCIRKTAVYLIKKCIQLLRKA